MSTREEEREGGEYEGVWTELDNAVCQTLPNQPLGMLLECWNCSQKRYISKCNICSPLWVSFQRQIPFTNIITNNKYCCNIWAYSHKHAENFSYSSFKKRNEVCSEFSLLKYLCPVWKGEGHIFSTHSLYKINMKLWHSWCLTVDVFVSWNFVLRRFLH